MSDTPSTLRLPALQQTHLDPATLAALFRDLAVCAEVMSVLPKWAAQSGTTRTEAQPIPLDAAQAGLTDGTLRAAQIRYRFENRSWCDTLLRLPDGVRLVRICEDDIVSTLTPAA